MVGLLLSWLRASQHRCGDAASLAACVPPAQRDLWFIAQPTEPTLAQKHTCILNMYTYTHVYTHTGVHAPLGLENASRLLVTAIGILLGPKQRLSGRGSFALQGPLAVWEEFRLSGPEGAALSLWSVEARDAWANSITGLEFAGAEAGMPRRK